MFALVLAHSTKHLKKTCATLSSTFRVKPNPIIIVTPLHMLSHALCQLHVFTSNFDWFTRLPVKCDWLE